MKWINQLVKKTTPTTLLPLVKNLYYLKSDLKQKFSKEELIPPIRALAEATIGPGDYIIIGDHFKNLFIKLCHLSPDYKVLDVGCGIGRMAVPLTEYLSKNGEYWGMDIVANSVRWCQNNISKKYPNFHFHIANIYNKYYNPHGSFTDFNYKFIYRDNYFDFVFLTSVFTHMMPKGVNNYLSEIYRVLKPGAVTFITYFLLDNVSRPLLNTDKCQIKFKDGVEECKVVDINNPEISVAYDIDFIKHLYKINKFIIIEPINFGRWCGRESYFDFQDIIIAQKPIGENGER